MTAPTLTPVDDRNLLVSGGVPAGPPRRERARALPPCGTGPDITPVPADDTPAAREDWHAEVLGATWLRIP